MHGYARFALVVASLTAFAANDPPAETFPITVQGRAVDMAGKPVAGATVYIASTQPGRKRLAETTTDAEGRYKFHDVPLPIDLVTTSAGRNRGAFEIFGSANGYGFTWRPRKWFYPDGKPDDYADRPDEDQPVRFDASDRIVLDLIFPPPARFRGRVVNEKGEPIPGTTVSIQYCDPVWDQADYGVFRSRKKFESLNTQASVPDGMKRRTTDADGRFEFNELPPNCRFLIFVRPDGFPNREIYAVTRKGITADRHGHTVYSDGAVLTFVTPRDVRLRVLFANSGKPAANVCVFGTHADDDSTYRVTDAHGNVTLRLPPGECRYHLLPEKGTPYLETDGTFRVGEKPNEAPFEMKLNPAAVVEVTVIDALTGQPLRGVDLWTERPTPNGQPYRSVHHVHSWDATSRGGHTERARTDVNGKLTTLFEPGWHPIGVGLNSFPKGYVPTEPEGRAVECIAGKTTKVTFRMRPNE